MYELYDSKSTPNYIDWKNGSRAEVKYFVDLLPFCNFVEF